MLKKALEADRTQILNYCMSEPNLNIFIIGDIEHHGFDSVFQEVWMQTKGNCDCLGEGQGENASEPMEALTGIVLRYHDNMILYSFAKDMNCAEVSELIHSKTINIVSGKKSTIELIYPLLAEEFSKREMTFYELKDPSKLLKTSKTVQIATEDDAREISEAYGQIVEFEGLYSGDEEQRYLQIAHRITSEEGVHMIIRENGKIVCHGNTTAETSVSAMIGGVFTLPGYRGKGLASSIVSALSQYLISKKKSACLFYDNPNDSDFFERLGFGVIENWTILGRK